MRGWRQRVTRLVSAAVLWAIFRKTIIVTWISVPWWAALLMLVGLFVFIESLVSRTFSGKEKPRALSTAISRSRSEKSEAPEGATLDEVRKRISDFSSDAKKGE